MKIDRNDSKSSVLNLGFSNILREFDKPNKTKFWKVKAQNI